MTTTNMNHILETWYLNPIFWQGLIKVLVVVGAIITIILGYKLFVIGTKPDRARLEIKSQLLTIILSGTGAGLFFMVCGIFLLAILTFNNKAKIGSDGAQTFEISGLNAPLIDMKSGKLLVGPLHDSLLKEGKYSVAILSESHPNNSTNNPNFYFYVDRTSPAIVVSNTYSHYINTASLPTFDAKNGIIYLDINTNFPANKVAYDGKYTLIVTAEDKAGNSNDIKINFTIDKDSPSIIFSTNSK